MDRDKEGFWKGFWLVTGFVISLVTIMLEGMGWLPDRDHP